MYHQGKWFLVTWCGWQRLGLPGPVSPFVCSGWRAISGVRRMLRGAGILPGRQWLCIGPCKAYLWNATSSHPFILQSETLGSPSSWPSVDLHTALFLFLHKSLLVNVDLWEKFVPVSTPRLLCWRSDWVCNNKGGDTSITGFVFDHRVLFMSLELKTFLSIFIIESHFYNWISFSLRLYLYASQAGLGILGSRDLTVASFSYECGHRASHCVHCSLYRVLSQGTCFGLFILLLSDHKTLLVSSYPTHIRMYNMDNVF